ncbi:MAG: Hpt domain-containing protein, partial [Gammaproteobacteria bacterium]
MRTVSSAIKEDITRIKDTLDIFVRMGKSGVAELGPLDPLMKKVADTLGVLGLARLRESLELERVNLKKVLGGQRAADEATLMEIASGIVSVEGRLEASMLGLVVSAPPGTAADESRPERSELQDVQNAVIRESIINLARIKEAIVEYVNDPAKSQSLRLLPNRIREIQASLGFLQLERMAMVLESVRQFIGRRLLAQSAAPGQNELDCMADAIVSVEFYLEAIQLGRANPVSMLDNAEACVAALGFPVGRAYDDIPPPAGEPQAESTSVESSVLEADSIVIEPVRTIAIESVVIHPAEAPAWVSEPGVEAPAPRPAQPSAAGPAVVPLGEVDPEILQIFLEEAQEEMQTLRDNFPRWRSNPADREALTTVRRSFHTLKGSGRMVGARLIGEFAWSFENMLNRVIEQTIEPSDGMYR